MAWSKGHLTFEGQLWAKGSLRSGLQFDVSTTNQFAMVQELRKLFWKSDTFCLINLWLLHKSFRSTWTMASWWMVDTSKWSPSLRLPLGQWWPSKANWPFVQSQLKKVRFFMFLASAEAVLRPRPDFNVPSESSWVGLSNGALLVLLRWKLRLGDLISFMLCAKIFGSLYLVWILAWV